jgi:hypothetical protein
MSGKLTLPIEQTDYRSWFLVEMNSGISWAQPAQGATLMPNDASSLSSITLLYRQKSQEIALK